MSKSFRVSFTAVVCSVLTLAACQNADQQQWSTKQESIFQSGSPTLNVPAESLWVEIEREDRESLREASLQLLQQAMESSDPLLRANAIEAMHYAPHRLDSFVQRGLADENRGVRFIAAMTLGSFEMRDLMHLAYPLMQDPSPSVQAAAIYALHRCGEKVNPSPLAAMLRSGNPEVKANAALVLGELGNPSAVPMLRSAVGQDMARVSTARAQVVDLQLAEAMVKLGDERQLEVIRAALFAPAEQGELIALGCLMIGRLGDVRAVPNLVQLARREGQRGLPAEVRMAATLALAELDPSEAPAEVPLEFAQSNRFEHRAQAALTLGAIPHNQSLPTLRRLLSDENPMVQVFAAGGILRQTAPG